MHCSFAKYTNFDTAKKKSPPHPPANNILLKNVSFSEIAVSINSVYFHHSSLCDFMASGNADSDELTGTKVDISCSYLLQTKGTFHTFCCTYLHDLEYFDQSLRFLNLSRQKKYFFCIFKFLLNVKKKKT